MRKIVIFASGSGSNAEKIILHFNKKKHVKVVGIFTNNPNAKVIGKAAKYNIPTIVFSKEELNEGNQSRFNRSGRISPEIPRCNHSTVP